jgi:hypothetical protein
MSLTRPARVEMFHPLRFTLSSLRPTRRAPRSPAPIVDPGLIEHAWQLAREAEEASHRAFAAPAESVERPAEMSEEDRIREYCATCSTVEVLLDEPAEPTTASAIAEPEVPAATAPFGTPWCSTDEPLTYIAQDFELLFTREPSIVTRLLSALSTCDAHKLAKLFRCPIRDAGEPAGDAPPGSPAEQPDEAGVLWHKPGGMTEQEMMEAAPVPQWNDRGERINKSQSVFPKQAQPRGSWRSSW